jgi:cbb3-type cytochrome c oxidase subunit III
MNRFTAVILLGTLAAALGIGTRPASAASNAYEGRRLFTTYCLVCHGPKGDGQGPLATALKKSPANFLNADVAKKSDQELYLTIDSGKSHEGILGMPRWSTVLPPPQIEDIISYIRFLERSRYPLVGDPQQGRDVYRTYCTVCHGGGGKGDGVMTQLLPIHPADHTNRKAMDAISNEDLARTIADGELVKYMPAWKTVLNAAEIESLVGYIRLLSH